MLSAGYSGIAATSFSLMLHRRAPIKFIDLLVDLQNGVKITGNHSVPLKRETGDGLAAKNPNARVAIGR